MKILPVLIVCVPIGFISHLEVSMHLLTVLYIEGNWQRDQ